MRSTTQLTDERRSAEAKRLAERIFAQHRPRLLAIARRNSARREDAEEALQDSLVQFIAHFDPAGRAHPMAWLTLTLKRRCWALNRQGRRQRPLGLRPEGDSQPLGELLADFRPLPDEQAEARERVVEIHAGFAELKPQEQRALALLALGYGYREICALTGWTYTKVNRCLAEGRASLRRREDGSRPSGIPR